MRESKYLEYRAARSTNRDVFLLNHREFVESIDELHSGLREIANGLLGKNNFINGIAYNDLFISSLALMQRQVLSAFDHLSSVQAYQAWVMARPAIEIPLIMGKWIDKPSSVEIWQNREKNFKQYLKEFQGKQLQSTALPRSKQIQKILKRLNDLFLHPNIDYYKRHLHINYLENGAQSIKLEYFDKQVTIEANVLAFLHLIGIIHDSVHEMISSFMGGIPGSNNLAYLIENRFGNTRL